jgi:hypothetical protein
MTVLLVKIVLYFWRVLAYNNEDVAIGLIASMYNDIQVQKQQTHYKEVVNT